MIFINVSEVANLIKFISALVTFATAEHVLRIGKLNLIGLAFFMPHSIYNHNNPKIKEIRLF